MDKDPISELRKIVGDAGVRTDDATLTEYGKDMTENPPRSPSAVVMIEDLDQLQAVVKLAAELAIPLTPRVAGTNLGGLTIPAEGGWTLDLTRMNRIVDINLDDMVAVLEPGVTFGQLRRALDERRPLLTIGYPLSPPETSIAANCLLDGLGNLSLKHGAMGEWISSLEVVRADGSLLRTGASALGVPVPFGRAPMPDLGGLFVSFQGTTGIVSKISVQLWPQLPFRERAFVMAYDHRAAIRALRELPKLDLLHDLGSLSWPTGKMIFGVAQPVERDPAEPEFFLYMDLAAATRELMEAKKNAIRDYLAGLRKDGLRIEDPIDVPTLVALEPRFGKLADFPTRLDFLVDHPFGGLTWVGTYGPMSRFEAAVEKGNEIMARHRYPPIIVARPMQGGHFGVVRYIEVFQRDSEAERERVMAVNRELCEALRQLGFIMYKTPGWAVASYRDHFDPGFVRLMREIRGVLDPQGIMNPDRWNIPNR